MLCDDALGSAEAAMSARPSLGKLQRTRSRGPSSVDASSMFQLDGESVHFKNGVELAGLLAKSETVHRCYSDRWLEYALGRPVANAESGAVEILAQVSAQNSAKLDDLLAAVTRLQTFRARTDQEDAR